MPRSICGRCRRSRSCMVSPPTVTAQAMVVTCSSKPSASSVARIAAVGHRRDRLAHGAVGPGMQRAAQRLQVVQPASSRNSATRAAQTSLAVTCASRSPSTWSGTRTLSRNELHQRLVPHALAQQAASAGCGCLPRTARGNPPTTALPPTSGYGRWSRRSRPGRRDGRSGETAVMSGRWPVASQGSLVMTQSPGRQVSAGNFAEEMLGGARQDAGELTRCRRYSRRR